MPPSIPNDIFSPSQSGEEKDELSIFSGKTHTVSTVSATPTSSVRSNGTVSPIAQNESSPPAYTDNPFFAGVHPSLISELNSFQPFIREQVQNAYRIGGDVFGAGPMMIDPIRRIPAGQITAPPPAQPPVSAPVGLEHQNAQKPFHQQWEEQQAVVRQQELHRERHERERRELERQESERQELERQELERQEIARQHQLEFERQQQEIQRQQEIRFRELQRQQQAQEEALRRQEEKAEQLQRQEQYRQQLEIQQRQLEQQHQQQMAQYQQQQKRQSIDVAMYAPEHPGVQTLPAAKAMAPPVQNSAPLSHVQRQISHSQSSSSLRQRYQQQQQYPQPSMHDMAPQHTGMPTHTMTPQHMGAPPQQRLQQSFQQQLPNLHGTGPVIPQHNDGMSSHVITPQHTGVPQMQRHSMYTVSPSEYAQQRHDQIAPPVGYAPPPASSYGSSSTIAPSTPTVFVPETYKYWPAASTSFAVPVEQAPAVLPGYTSQPALQPRPQYHHQQYTPDAALRGIAADDRSLQETWQSYMNKVCNVIYFILFGQSFLIQWLLGRLSSTISGGLRNFHTPSIPFSYFG